ncbi:MAG: hypothetical protein ACU0FT_14655, partial [Paracoccus sp. (in: a-proteobacteria)]|uniref:hypothetical protein n=1 Tax=Paracoccus sp. TaxID=267 RepID=UPI004058AC3B
MRSSGICAMNISLLHAVPGQFTQGQHDLHKENCFSARDRRVFLAKMIAEDDFIMVSGKSGDAGFRKPGTDPVRGRDLRR